MNKSCFFMFILAAASPAFSAVTYTTGPTSPDGDIPYDNPVMEYSNTVGMTRNGTDTYYSINYLQGTSYTVDRSYTMRAVDGELGTSTTTYATGDMSSNAVTTMRSTVTTDDFEILARASRIADATIKFDLDGVLGIERNNILSGVAWGEVTVTVILATQTQTGTARYYSTVFGPQMSTSGVLSGITGPVINETLSFNFTGIAANVPLDLTIHLDASSGARTDNSATWAQGSAIFANTLTLTTSGPVVESTDSNFVSANSGSLNLVDNNFTIPEPGTAILFSMAGMVLLTSRRRH